MTILQNRSRASLFARLWLPSNSTDGLTLASLELEFAVPRVATQGPEGRAYILQSKREYRPHRGLERRKRTRGLPTANVLTLSANSLALTRAKLLLVATLGLPTATVLALRASNSASCSAKLWLLRVELDLRSSYSFAEQHKSSNGLRRTRASLELGQAKLFRPFGTVLARSAS